MFDFSDIVDFVITVLGACALFAAFFVFCLVSLSF